MEQEKKKDGRGRDEVAEVEEDLVFPLAPLAQTLFPGSFLLITVFERQFKNVIGNLLGLPPGRRLMCLFQDPDQIDGNNKDVVIIGSLVKLCNVYAMETPSSPKVGITKLQDLVKQPKFLILVKCVSRVRLIDCYPIYEDDHEERKEKELEEEGEEEEDEELYEEVQVSIYEDVSPHLSPPQSKENMQMLRNAIEHSHSFAKRFAANSIWQNILLRTGPSPLPLNTPFSSLPAHLSDEDLCDLASKYSFWLASASLLFGISGSTKVVVETEQEQLKRKIFATTSPFERLELAFECFKKLPPVKQKLPDFSEAAVAWDNVPQTQTEEGLTGFENSRVKYLKDIILINICKYLSEIFEASEEDRPTIKAKYEKFVSSFQNEQYQLPGEIYERILIFMHRQERLTLPLLQYFNELNISQNVEVLFASNITQSNVDDSWLDEILKFKNLRILDLSGSYKITNKGIDKLLRHIGPQLRSLYLNRCKKIDCKQALLQLYSPSEDTPKFDHLESLHIAGLALEEQIFFTAESTQNLKQVSDLNVSGTKFNDAMLHTFKKQRIVSIDLGSTSIKNDSGQVITGWSETLQALSIGFVSGVTDWEFLKHLNKLRMLDVRLNSSFDEQVMRWWNLNDLNSLNISKTEVTDATVVQILSQMQCLRFLDASKNNISDLALVDYLQKQGKEATLEELYLQYTHVGIGVAKQVKNCGKLKVFKATGSPGFGDREVLEMTKEYEAKGDNFNESNFFLSLQTLDVGGEAVTDAGIKNIGMLKGIKHVGIWSSRVTPLGAMTIKNQTGLGFDDKMRTTKGTYIFRA